MAKTNSVAAAGATLEAGREKKIRSVRVSPLNSTLGLDVLPDLTSAGWNEG